MLHTARTHRKHEREDVLSEIKVQIALEAPRNSDVRYIEELIVHPTRKTDIQTFTYTAVSAIAAAYVFDAKLIGTIAARDCRQMA